MEKMENIFIHDATATWSGFIYQGEIAIYLAVKKICELRDVYKLGIDEIGSKYQIEVENCEDIAIVNMDEEGKRYISIHQVKNQDASSIGDYRRPLTQLMLEKGFHTKEHLGNPEAYLHVSNKISEKSETDINQHLKEWEESIRNYFFKMKDLIVKLDKVDDKKSILQEIKKEVHNEPIKINRKEYNELKRNIKDTCNKESNNIEELKQVMGELISFLDKKLGASYIDKEVQVYQYEDGNTFCRGTDIFKKIVEQVKRYKQDDKNITLEQYEYITDKLLHYMRGHVIKRHQRKQKGVTFEKSIAFCDIINILNDSLENYEKEANILALRRLYDEYLSQYCELVCKEACLDSEDQAKECKLQQNEYTRVDLNNEDFKKLCYSFNPDCNKTIFDRRCLNSLLDKNGLIKSVFEIIKKVPEQNFMKEDDKTRFVIDNKNNNAFLTAISNSISNVVVDDIVQGIENNAELIKPIFEADQIITANLKASKSIWENKYSEIQEIYIRSVTEINEETNQNSICKPKKPEFIKSEEIIGILSNY
ncbi:hypothetical protein EHE19_006525 [Ruminiclostridium herbifermentans]|uniref:ABC-three component systems C-terminal domain-containing protein n=1 Tax=Ruminiclostridium herbifermentans TaxID=2488810 RepID=A0A4U7JAR9_9FIRM|nr:ABC-three component system protein [Ruminiclostridium herbifermentans]QNU68088.1 hypothetical protein EHE19_006525 [Ruminiclostridium herbifermentans]